MEEARDPRWWRDEAKRLRGVGQRYKQFDGLQPSFCALAHEYERIADLVEQENPPAAQKDAEAGSQGERTATPSRAGSGIISDPAHYGHVQ